MSGAKLFPPDWTWDFHPDTGKPIALASPAGDVLLATGDDRHSWLEISDEHMRAIAALPELLAACRGLLTCSLPVDISGQRCIDAAVAAIAKYTN